MKTARFADVVAHSGAPEAYPLWLPPARDKIFQAALKQHRVLTIHQENVGSKKDFAMVGFHEQPYAQYLVFPKSLRTFADRRIIGIHYDLMAKDGRGESSPPVEKTQKPRTTAAKAPPRPAASPVAAAASKQPSHVRSGTGARARPPRVEPAARNAPSAHEDSTSSGAEVPPSPPNREQPETATRAAKTPLKQAPAAAAHPDARLLAEVRRALKELKAGKTVAAYQRLEKVVAAGPS